MSTTPTPVERAAAAIHADCGPDFIAEYDDLEPETQAQWRGYAQHALDAALDVDEIARVLAPDDWRMADDPRYAHLPDGARESLLRKSREQAAAVVAHLTRTGATR